MFLNGVLEHEMAGYRGLCRVGWMRWDANVNVIWHIGGVVGKCRYGVLMRMGGGWVFLNGSLEHERAMLPWTSELALPGKNISSRGGSIKVHRSLVKLG